MAGSASISSGFVLEDEGAGLGLVTLYAGFSGTHGGYATAHDRISMMWIVAVVAGDLVTDGVGVSEGEGTFDIEMALVAGFGIGLRVMYGSDLPAAVVVDASGTVASLASHVERVVAVREQLRVGRSVEVGDDFLVAFFAALHAHEGCSGNLRWAEICLVVNATRSQNHHDGDTTDDGDPALARAARV